MHGVEAMSSLGRDMQSASIWIIADINSTCDLQYKMYPRGVQQTEHCEVTEGRKYTDVLLPFEAFKQKGACIIHTTV